MDQELIKQVKKLDITTKQLVDGLMSGNYHSIFKGQGIEFSEIREYSFGDDIRYIDWNVTARMDKPYIKEFIEERDLNVVFAFDVSSSGSFGSVLSKKRKAIEIIASLLFSAIKNNDNCGLFMFTENVERHIPSRKGKKHALSILSNILQFTPKSKKTNIHNSLMHIAKVLKKRSIVFVISDFFPNNFSDSLKILKCKHDVIAIKMGDTREQLMPDVGLIMLEDEETGEQVLVDTSNQKFRERFENIIKQEESKINSQFKKLKVDCVSINTSEKYEIPLRKFFKMRKKRVR